MISGFAFSGVQAHATPLPCIPPLTPYNARAPTSGRRCGFGDRRTMRTLFALLVCAAAFRASPARADARSVHVFVALADNKHQGIVPVPAKLGNGDDPRNNLYWGALYGVKTYLRKSRDWTLLSTTSRPTKPVLERCVFQHKNKDVFLVADAYRGAEIRQAVADFLSAAGGKGPAVVRVSGRRIKTHGAADLVAYVGHNGLMDFTIQQAAAQAKGRGRDAIVLACKSKPYFGPRLSRLKARAVLLTTGLMAPEAYTLEAALDGWIAGASPNEIRDKAARAYHKYQKCGLRAARRLFVSEE